MERSSVLRRDWVYLLVSTFAVDMGLRQGMDNVWLARSFVPDGHDEWANTY